MTFLTFPTNINLSGIIDDRDGGIYERCSKFAIIYKEEIDSVLSLLPGA